MGAHRTPEIEPPYLYECIACGYRVESERRSVECPECGEQMRNLGTPSE